jgi:hypothetical protein
MPLAIQLVIYSPPRACEADVVLRTYGLPEQEFAVDYGPYQDATVFLALVDTSSRYAG